jgi:hypothetical protein
MTQRWYQMLTAPLDGTVIELACRQEDGTLYRIYGYFGRYLDEYGDGWTDGSVKSWGYQESTRLEPIAWRDRQLLTENEIYKG